MKYGLLPFTAIYALPEKLGMSATETLFELKFSLLATIEEVAVSVVGSVVGFSVVATSEVSSSVV